MGVTGSSVLINLSTVFGRQYEIQYRTNLVAGTWITLQATNGNGAVIIIKDSVTNDASRFYRAAQMP